MRHKGGGKESVYIINMKIKLYRTLKGKEIQEKRKNLNKAYRWSEIVLSLCLTLRKKLTTKVKEMICPSRYLEEQLSGKRKD